MICLILAVWMSVLGIENAFAETQYDEIFPLYVQSCALTRIKKANRPPGAPWGHAVVYVKGMCRDKSVEYPRVKVCGDEIDLTDFNSGTLVSVEPGFKNTNWVAIEGGRFAFSGDLQPGEVVDTAVMNRTMKQVVDSGALKGISLHKAWAKRRLPGMTEEENIAKFTAGTHYAIDYGRTAYCNVIPIAKPQLESIVAYLNEVNAPYIEKEKKFKWDAFNNNCVHIVRNVLAAAHVSSYQPVGRHYPIGIFDLLIPGKQFVKLAEEGMESNKLSVTDVFADKVKRESLEQFGMPSVTHGVITRVYEMRSENNEYFMPTRVLAIEVFRSRGRILRNILARNAMHDLRENLHEFEAKYLGLRDQLKPLPQMISEKKRFAKPEFQLFYTKYVEWLDKAIVDVREKLNQLDQI